jgi:hypothetical protein
MCHRGETTRKSADHGRSWGLPDAVENKNLQNICRVPVSIAKSQSRLQIVCKFAAQNGTRRRTRSGSYVQRSVGPAAAISLGGVPLLGSRVPLGRRLHGHRQLVAWRPVPRRPSSPRYRISRGILRAAWLQRPGELFALAGDVRRSRWRRPPHPRSPSQGKRVPRPGPQRRRRQKTPPPAVRLMFSASTSTVVACGL